jgi:hypothetical protein
MLSLLYVLLTDGYGKLILEPLPLSMLLLLPSSGMAGPAILCDDDEMRWDDDEARLMRSLEERSRTRSGSAPSSLEPDERVLCERLLLWRR